MDELAINAAGRHISVASGSYGLPVDAAEASRLEAGHSLSLHATGGLLERLMQPLLDQEDEPHVLDIGAGTGAWLRDFANRWPHASYTGLDAASTMWQPGSSNETFLHTVAPMCLSSLASEAFDVIHIKDMLCAYDALLSECFRLLKPGGILLVHETLGELASQWEGFDPEDLTPGLAYWMRLWRWSCTQRGVDPSRTYNMEAAIESAGFHTASSNHGWVHLYDPDVGSWGHYAAQWMLATVDASTGVMLDAGLDEEELNDVRKRSALELSGQSAGSGGATAAAGVLLGWSYWWAMK